VTNRAFVPRDFDPRGLSGAGQHLCRDVAGNVSCRQRQISMW